MSFNLDNEVFSNFAFYTGVCTLKLIGLSTLCVYRRVSGNVFANPEDCKSFGGDKLKPKLDDLAVERARRNHLNHLENLAPFFITGLLYVSTGPAVGTALLHFRIFTAARFLHTICYQVPLPQPSRFLCHLVSVGVIISMGARVVMAAQW